MNLGTFSVSDLVSKAGGCHLVPKNADLYTELLRVSILALTHGSRSPQAPPATHDQWKRVITSSEVRNGMPGDPHEGIYVTEVVCFGGAYLVMPTESPDEHTIVQYLLEAALLRTGGAFDAFRRELAATAICALYISDRCIRSAGLSRTSMPKPSPNGLLCWPDADQAARLQNAVTLPLDEVARHLRTLGLSARHVSQLTLQDEQLTPCTTQVSADAIRTRPLLLLDDRIIVASPSTLLTALRHAILAIAREHNVLTHILRLYHAAIHDTVVQCVHDLGCTVHATQHFDHNDIPFTESVCRFDIDKLALYVTLTDGIRARDSTIDDAYWNAHDELQAIIGQVEAHTNELLDNNPEPVAKPVTY